MEWKLKEWIALYGGIQPSNNTAQVGTCMEQSLLTHVQQSIGAILQPVK